MMRSWVRWVAVLGGGILAGLCVALLYRKVQQENLQPTALLKLVSLLLLGLGFALPWWLVSRWHHRQRFCSRAGESVRHLARILDISKARIGRIPAEP